MMVEIADFRNRQQRGSALTSLRFVSHGSWAVLRNTPVQRRPVDSGLAPLDRGPFPARICCCHGSALRKDPPLERADWRAYVVTAGMNNTPAVVWPPPFCLMGRPRCASCLVQRGEVWTPVWQAPGDLPGRQFQPLTTLPAGYARCAGGPYELGIWASAHDAQVGTIATGPCRCLAGPYGAELAALAMVN